MGVLEDRFGVPPFSVLDTKQKYWLNRKKEWRSIGIQSEVGRNARAFNIKEWIEDKEKSGGGSSQETGKLSDVSIFDPVLCELSYKWFCKPKGTILDPFAGGSVRGVVASVLGYEYTGVDLRPEQTNANYDNISKLSLTLPVDPVWITGDSMDIKNIGGEYDMIFSCPPYHDLEEYSKDPKDLSNMSYEKFVENYSEIIKRSCSMLKNDSFAVFVVGEIRDKDGFYKNFVGDTVNAFLNAGMKYYNEGILQQTVNTMSLRVSKQFEPYRKLGKLHQNILIFYKGDPKNISLMNIDSNKFTPLTSLNEPKRPRSREFENKILGEVEIETPKEDTVCKLCGVDYTGMTYEQHETRPFHQNCLE
jgi:DNA modification methylase